MREAEFKAWMAESHTPGTVSTQLSKVRKLERHFGDLDELFSQGSFPSIVKQLKSDTPSPAIEALGNTGERAHLPTSLNYYKKFLESAGPQGSVAYGLSRSDILAAVARCDAAGSVEAFIAAHDKLGPPTKYWLVHEGRRYPSKAIVHDALGHIGSAALPGGGPAKKALDALEFVVIDWPQFEQFRERFLTENLDFIDFSVRSGRYWDTEREYKEQITAKVRAIAASAADARTAGEAILRALSVGGKYLPIGWRAVSEVSAAPKELHERFYTAVGTLARSTGDASEAVGAAAHTFEQLRADGITGLRRGMVLGIAITVLGTIKPLEGTWFKVSKVEQMGQRLFGRKLFAGEIFEPADFDEYLQLMRALFELMKQELGWKPTDLFDVQGFVWVALGEAETAELESEPAVADEQPNRRSILEKPSVPTNLILYGPPGTGKTFSTMAEAVRLSGKPLPVEPSEVQAVYKALVEAGQVKFVTFHQNYAYEDFVEGLRPVTGGESSSRFSSRSDAGHFS